MRFLRSPTCCVAPLYCCDNNNTTYKGEATRQGNTFLSTKTAYLLPQWQRQHVKATRQGNTSEATHPKSHPFHAYSTPELTPNDAQALECPE
jgi:hypothetical protein